LTELDLGLKVGVRRLLWQMGYSTRLDVQLRGESISTIKTLVSPSTQGLRGRGSGKSPAIETFTDLDVLGVLINPGFGASTVVADCKTGTSDKPVARMFWARGVADLFGAMRSCSFGSTMSTTPRGSYLLVWESPYYLLRISQPCRSSTAFLPSKRRTRSQCCSTGLMSSEHSPHSRDSIAS
jgi:hypothetical protein